MKAKKVDRIEQMVSDLDNEKPKKPKEVPADEADLDDDEPADESVKPSLFAGNGLHIMIMAAKNKRAKE